jgi:hypothetical protein
VENVFVSAGAAGAFTVRVTAANIAGDGVPDLGDSTDQDYALVIYNGAVAPQAVLGVTAIDVSDAAGNSNGIVDPGEPLAFDMGLTNAGTLTATGVSGVLSVASGSVTVTQPNATYPNLAPAAIATNTTPYLATVGADQVCGQPLALSLAATFNVTQTLHYSFTVPVGSPVTALAESFDGVTAPSFPAGWAAAVLTGTVTPWRTVITNTHTPPNSAFAPGHGTVSDNVLVSAPFTVISTAAQLTFQNRYDLETGSTLGFDGGVLEIKIGGGVFTDVVAAGGSFVTGDYNKVLSSAYSNPLSGRMAWSGDSGGYVPTVVSLPPAAVGQTVQLRWRIGTDSSVSRPGQWIDTLTLMDGFACTPFSGGSFKLYLPLSLR